jgi:hypothetical protein
MNYPYPIFILDKMSYQIRFANTSFACTKPFALTPPDPAALAPLSQAWERGWE